MGNKITAFAAGVICVRYVKYPEKLREERYVNRKNIYTEVKLQRSGI